MVDKSHYNSEVPVSEETLDEIRQLGMAASIQKAVSGQASPEFMEAVRRFYPAVVDQVDQTIGSGMPQLQGNAPVDVPPMPDPSQGAAPVPGNEAMERRALQGNNPVSPPGGGQLEGGGMEPPSSPGLIDTQSRPGKVALNLDELNPVKSGVIDTSREGRVGLDLKRLVDVLGLGFDPPDISGPDMSKVFDTQSRPGKIGLNLGALFQGGGGGEKAMPPKAPPSGGPPPGMMQALQRRMQNTGGGGRLQ